MRKETDEIFSQRKVDVIHSAYIVHTLYQQQKLGKYCDLKVLVGDKQYFVHRCILAAASAQLDSQINGLDTIQLVGVTYYGFECLLEILYSGKLNDISMLSDSKFQQIVSAADALNAEIVMEYCTRERGDLMNILLSQSNAANQSVQHEAPSGNENYIPATMPHEPTAMDQTSSYSNVGVEKSEADTTPGNSMPPTNEVLNKDVKTEARAPKSDEYGYSEGPVAAEVEVDSMQKPDGLRPGEVPAVDPNTVAPAVQENVPRNDRHISEGGIPCVVCGALFHNPTDLSLHMQTHLTEQLYKCDICGLHLKYEAALISHKKAHCTCQICGQEFKTLIELQSHHEEFHADMIVQAQVTSVSQASGSKPNRVPKRKSGVTPSMTRNKIGGKPAINPVVVNEIMRGENGKYQCPLCDRGFDRRWNLKCHVLIHTAPEKDKKVTEARYAEAVFTCPECGKMFRNLHNLRRHASSMHGMKAADLEEASDGMPGEYNAANKRNRKEVMEQQSSTTTDDFKFWCNICGRGFKRNRNLRGHLEAHQSQGLAKYECPVCHRKFAQKESLNGHLWVHKTNRESESEPKSDFAVRNT